MRHVYRLALFSYCSVPPPELIDVESRSCHVLKSGSTSILHLLTCVRFAAAGLYFRVRLNFARSVLRMAHTETPFVAIAKRGPSSMAAVGLGLLQIHKFKRRCDKGTEHQTTQERTKITEVALPLFRLCC